MDVLVGDVNGIITVWGQDQYPKYAWKAHNSQITKLQYIPQTKQLISSCKEKVLKTWQISGQWIPEKWHEYNQSQSKMKQGIGNKLIESHIMVNQEELQNVKGNQNKMFQYGMNEEKLD